VFVVSVLFALSSRAHALTAAELRAVADASTVELTTTGRTSGQPRAVEIWFVLDDDRLYVQSGKGGTTDWYRNLTANPAVSLRIGSLALRGRARPIDAASETARIHALFEQKYVRARVFGWFGGQTGHGKVVLIDQLQSANQ
jgi:deazaflavin-dependent oxidoreductase (nitroreductase family)